MNKLKVKFCPYCKKEYAEHSAISRIDNKTEICSTCGFIEAILSFREIPLTVDTISSFKYLD